MPDGALARLATFRSDAYRLLAQVFLHPTCDRVTAIGKAASSLQRRRSLLAASAIGYRWTALLCALQDFPVQRVTDLQAQFTHLFGLDGAGGCPPYESHYVTYYPGQGAVIIAVVEWEYAEQGMVVDAAVGEPPDHAAVELEFMAVLCAREATAWSATMAEQGARTLAPQQQFLRRHLGRWFPQLARAVAGAGPGSLYAAAADAAASFIHHDQDLIDLLLSRLTEGTQSVGEPAQASGR